MAQISRLKDAEIENGNLIDADDLDAEFDQLISAHNTNDTELTNIGTGTYSFSGVKTFTSSPKTNGIDERTAGSGVTIGSVRLKNGMAKIAGTPTEGGEIGYASNRLTYHNGSAVITLPNTSGYAGVTSRSSNTILAAADLAYLIDCTSTFTQTLTAAATLGSAWFCYIRNSGTGIITIDPNSAETIDGAATIPVFPGEAFTLICDGSNFKTIGRSTGGWQLIETLSPSAASTSSTTLGFGLNYDHLFVVDRYVPSTDAVTPWVRVSVDGGSTYRSTAGDYQHVNGREYPSGGYAPTGSGSDTEYELVTATAGSSLGTAAGETPHHFEVTLFDPEDTSNPKLFKHTVIGSIASDGTFCEFHGAGRYKGTNDNIDGIRFGVSSGTFTAVIQHYVRRRG